MFYDFPWGLELPGVDCNSIISSPPPPPPLPEKALVSNAQDIPREGMMNFSPSPLKEKERKKKVTNELYIHENVTYDQIWKPFLNGTAKTWRRGAMGWSSIYHVNKCTIASFYCVKFAVLLCKG